MSCTEVRRTPWRAKQAAGGVEERVEGGRRGGQARGQPRQLAQHARRRGRHAEQSATLQQIRGVVASGPAAPRSIGDDGAMAGRTPLRSLTSLNLAALALAALALAPLVACGSDDGPTADATTTSTSTTLPAMPADFDWWDPSPTPIGHGWVLERCTEDLLPATVRTTVKGAPPSVLCFDNPDGRHGIVRLFRFLAPDDGDVNAHAARFVDDFIADRKQGCGEAYVVKAEPIVGLDLVDGPARRYGFTGGASGSRHHRAHRAVGRHPRRGAGDHHGLGLRPRARASSPTARAPSTPWRRSSPASTRS